MTQLGLFTLTWAAIPALMPIAQQYLCLLAPEELAGCGYLLDADTHEEAWREAERRWGPCVLVVHAPDPPPSPFDTPPARAKAQRPKTRQKRTVSNITPRG